MNDEELIARLRAANAYKGPDFNTPIADPIKVAAAARIEALVRELATSNEIGRAFEEDAGQQRDRAERLEAVLRIIIER